jgi:MFS family permease
MSETTASSWSKDVKVISLVSIAHGCSHYFQLVLPPLFPILTGVFDVGYTELGFVMTLFFVTSGFGQVIAGFLVDHFGAKRVLILGMALYSFAVLCFAMAQSFWMFYPAAVLLGLGNCVFHPSDFTIMNASISGSRIGRAFGMHTLGGNLGWAAAPFSMLAIAWLVNWRVALVVAALIGFAITAALWYWRRDITDRVEEPANQDANAKSMSLGPMLTAPIILCFLYFSLLALALIAVQNFLPPTLEAMYDTPLTIGNTALTGFLLGASVGVVIGGVLADRTNRYSLMIAVGLLLAALAFASIAVWNLPTVLLVAATSLAGLLTGLTTPSRDMLVRAASPANATGRIFGFVYSGLDVGSALAPISIGIMLDYGEASALPWAIAIVLILAIGTAVAIRPQN